MKFSKIRMEIHKDIVHIDFKRNMIKGRLDSGKSHPIQVIIETRFKNSNSKLFKSKKYPLVELFANYMANKKVDTATLLQYISTQNPTEDFLDKLWQNVWTSRAKK